MNLSSPSLLVSQSPRFFSYLKEKKKANIKFEQDLDETEQRIADFLESNGIHYKNPLDKYYDYMDKLREQKNSNESLSSSKSIGQSSDGNESDKLDKEEKKKQCFSLTSSLYKKRKISNNIPNI